MLTNNTVKFFSDIWPTYSQKFKTRQTARVYLSVINNVLSVTKRTEFLDLSEQDIVRYQTHLSALTENGRMEETTAALKSNVLKSVCGYLSETIEDYENPTYFVRFLDLTDSVPELIPDDVVQNLLAGVSGDFEIAVNLVLYCGLTLHELCQLSPAGFCPPYLTVHSYGYSRIITLPKHITRLIKQKSEHNQNFLLLAQHGKPMTERTMQRYFSKACPGYTLRDLHAYSVAGMFAAGLEDETVIRYTGILKKYRRYKAAAQVYCPVISPDSYAHII